MSVASSRNPEAPGRIQALISACRPGWSLPGPFYSDPAVYNEDLLRIWRTGWIFAGHSCEISNPGDFFVVEAGSDSVVVLRDETGIPRAFHNVCRHRGSLICAEPCGHTTRLVCPYHQWTYALDGRLVGSRGMPSDFNREDFSLKALAVAEIGGLIFISLAPESSGLEEARASLEPLLAPQGLAQSKVACAVDYMVHANWKLVWENNRECYHCNANHPQYIKANFDHYNADDTTSSIRARMDEAAQGLEEHWATAGIPTHAETGMTRFPDAGRNIWYSGNRTPLVEGWVSESMDGKQVAPLMGDYRDPEVGTLRIRTLPNFWNHSSCDHGVSTRLLPAGPERTAVKVYWLVHRDAVEGRDYSLDRLMPFWQLTSEQDWKICERQQRGVTSSAYQPGPYSTLKEYNVSAFIQWYLQKLSMVSTTWL